MLYSVLVMLITGLMISCASQQKATGSSDDQPDPGTGLNIVVKPGTPFATGDTITIVNKMVGEDAAGIEGILTNQLMAQGFHVIPGSTVKTVYRYAQESAIAQDNVNEMNAELYRVMELNSVYVLEFSGKVYLDFLRLPRHYDFTNFSATIMDITTGEIVVSGNFTGNRPVEEVCSEFVDLMVAQLH